MTALNCNEEMKPGFMPLMKPVFALNAVFCNSRIAKQNYHYFIVSAIW